MDELKLKVLKNSTFGRYAVAAQNLSAGELIHEESPFVLGPKYRSNPVCLECYKLSSDKCKNCGWPLCLECQHIGCLKGFHYLECGFFSKVQANFQNCDVNQRCLQLDCIMPLRLLLKIEKEPEKWENEVKLMEYHDEARRLDVSAWEEDENNIVNYLLLHSNRFSRDQIQRAIGILAVNVFEGRTIKGQSIRCLYPKFGVVAHSCVPNTIHTIKASDNFSLKAFAATDIPKESTIFASYTFTLSTTNYRQDHLRQSKYFDCKCERCLSPTELDTNLSSFRCIRCDAGIMLPLDPTNQNEEWQCDDCGIYRYGQDISRTVKVLQNELNEILTYRPTPHLVEELNYFYYALKKVLHPNHYILQMIRYNLIVLNCEEVKPLPSDLKRNVNYCNSLLAIIDVIEPGKTRFRAEILYYLCESKLKLLKSDFNDECRESCEWIVKKLGEVIVILQNEDEESEEGFMKLKAIKMQDSLANETFTKSLT